MQLLHHHILLRFITSLVPAILLSFRTTGQTPFHVPGQGTIQKEAGSYRFTGRLPGHDMEVPLSDGPYVFYDNNGQPLISTILNSCVETRPLERNPVKVESPGPDGGFTTFLQPLSLEKDTWPEPDKIFVISDIEGEFAAFRQLLIANRIIDTHYRWAFGKGHLVIDGDLFDRGKDVVPELWLIYKLEQEARQHGGYVHTILGNHDIMNLSGDLRYVDKKYFAAAKLMGKDYMQLYDKNTELGRWLRTKNVMEKIGDRLFVHGGVSPAVNQMGLSIAAINSLSRKYYCVSRKEIPKEQQDLFNQNALFWYRGYFMDPRATMQTVDNTLKQYSVKQIVVGHTIVKVKNPALYYDSKVLGVDVNEHEGDRAAVLIEHNRSYKVDDKGNKKLLQYAPGNDIISEKDID